MIEYEIVEKIKTAQKDEAGMRDLIDVFTPLLKKYAHFLNTEDAYDELLVDFIELIMGMKLNNLRNMDNKTLLLYIKKSTYHGYLKRKKEYNEYGNQIAYSVDDLSDKPFTKDLAICDSYEEMRDICEKCLTKAENETIVMIFQCGYSVVDIAKRKNVSRQAVNQIKMKALKKLHDVLEGHT